MSPDQRRGSRLLPGPTAEAVDIVAQDTTRMAAHLLDESICGLAVQVRDAEALRVGDDIEVGSMGTYRMAIVRNVTPRGPFFRIGLKWSNAPAWFDAPWFDSPV